MAPLNNLLPALTPTRTLPSLMTRVLLPRQATTTIIDGVVVTETTEEHHDVTLSGGAIAGIVIGSIVGLLLLWWLIRSCMNLGKPGRWGNTFGAKDDPRHAGRGPNTATTRRRCARAPVAAIIITTTTATAGATAAVPAAPSRSARSRLSALPLVSTRQLGRAAADGAPRRRQWRIILHRRRGTCGGSRDGLRGVAADTTYRRRENMK
ncbi:hypothetical protein PG988_002276 [Apiospora saccharicola]